MTVIHEVEHDANTGTLKLKKKRKVRKRKDANMEQMEADETLPRSLTDRRKIHFLYIPSRSLLDKN